MGIIEYAVGIIAFALFFFILFKLPDVLTNHSDNKVKIADRNLEIEKEKTEQARLNNETARFNAGGSRVS